MKQIKTISLFVAVMVSYANLPKNMLMFINLGKISQVLFG